MNFDDFIENENYSLEINSNNIVTGLLNNLLKKNNTYGREGYVINDMHAEIKLDVSGFKEELIKAAIIEFNKLDGFADTKNKIYYSSRVTFMYHNLTEEYIKLRMPKELFIKMRSRHFNKNIASHKEQNSSGNFSECDQLKLF